MISPASMLYQDFISGWAWLRIMVCFVVLSASGSGGFTFHRDFGPEVVEGPCGFSGIIGVVVACVIGVIFPHH